MSDKKNERENYPNTISIRLVRVELANGKIEVLVTSLTNAQQYPSKLFKDLYFKRWKVETYYDELKNKLNVELFSSYAENNIPQDFYCTIFVSNVQSLIVNDIQQDLKQQNKIKKYEYKVNTNLSYGFMKNKILDIFFLGQNTEKAIEELKELFLKHTVPIRPNWKYLEIKKIEESK